MFENTCSDSHFKKFRLGFTAELLVANHYLLNGYRWTYHRHKFYGVEIDLVFENDNEVILVEVKKTSHHDFLNDRISQRQKDRLYLAFANLQASLQKDLIFHYVVVDTHDKLYIFDDFL